MYFYLKLKMEQKIRRNILKNKLFISESYECLNFGTESIKDKHGEASIHENKF